MKRYNNDDINETIEKISKDFYDYVNSGIFIQDSNLNSSINDSQKSKSSKANFDKLVGVIFTVVIISLFVILSFPIFCFFGIVFLIILQCISLDYLGINLAGLISALGPVTTAITFIIKTYKIYKDVDKSDVKRAIKLLLKKFKEKHIVKKTLTIYLVIAIFGIEIGYNIPNARASVANHIIEYSEFIKDNIVESTNDDNANESGINNVNDNDNLNDNQTINENIKMTEGDYFKGKTFILNNKSYTITSELYSNVYCIKSSESIISYLKGTYNSNKPTYDFDCFDSTSQRKENDFTMPRENAKDFALINGRNSDWESILPEEETMIEAIKLQEVYSFSHKNYFIFNRISNNYQCLALEYIHQNADVNTAKYYYMKSIENDLNSLKYTTDEDKYYDVIKRLYYRYLDIESYCNINNAEKKLLNKYILDLENEYEFLSEANN